MFVQTTIRDRHDRPKNVSHDARDRFPDDRDLKIWPDIRNLKISYRISNSRGSIAFSLRKESLLGALTGTHQDHLFLTGKRQDTPIPDRRASKNKYPRSENAYPRMENV